MKNNEMTLFSAAGLIQTDEERALFTSKTKPIVNSKGVVVGSSTTYALAKAKDAREALHLEGKANKEEFERVQRDAEVTAFRRLKAMINTMDETQLALKRFSHKRAKDGLLDMTMRIKESPAKQTGLSLEQVAAAYGETLEQAKARFDKAGMKPATKVVVQDPALTQISEGQDEVAREAAETERQEAEAMAQLEKEEAEALAAAKK